MFEYVLFAELFNPQSKQREVHKALINNKPLAVLGQWNIWRENRRNTLKSCLGCYVYIVPCFFTRPRRDTIVMGDLCLNPCPAVKRAIAGQGNRSCAIMTARTSQAHITHWPLIPRRIYTQRRVGPIPPNGCSFIQLTCARGGNEVCHLYICDPWMTSLPHLPPPF